MFSTDRKDKVSGGVEGRWETSFLSQLSGSSQCIFKTGQEELGGVVSSVMSLNLDLIRGRSTVIRLVWTPTGQRRSPGNLEARPYAVSGESGSSNCSSLRIVPSISAAKESWGKSRKAHA